MKKGDMMKMRTEELRRLSIIKKVIDRQISQKEAGSLVGLSYRQVKRIVKRIKIEGDLGIMHKGRGRKSKRRISNKVKRKVMKLYEDRYQGFGPLLASEKLEEIEGIKVSKEKLRQWLMEVGLWERARKVRQHRQWRERKSSYGEMVQIDGSHHDWLEGRGPKLVLMGYIDDATSDVDAQFYDYEGTIPAMKSFYEYVRCHGLPLSVYLDRHSTYKSTGEATVEEQLEGKEAKSQFQRALEEELGVRVIHAYSPQAKGRIERLFRTFQDRLVKEMRLEGVKTKEEANKFLKGYLPKYNKQFRREPKSQIDLHRKVPKGVDLKRALSIREYRVLRNDNTIQHEGSLYQIELRWRLRRPKMVLVEERLDRKLYLMDQDRSLKYHKIERPVRVSSKAKVKGYFQMVRIPSKDHPWRKFSKERNSLAGSPC